MNRLFLLLGLLVFNPPDPGPILDGASIAFARVNTLSAEFVQIVNNPMIDAPDTTLGMLYQKRPNYFEMRFSKPKGDRIVADGKYLWLWTPSTTKDQVIRTPIPATGTTGPNLIGQFVDSARERYTARYLRAEGGNDVIELTPKQKDLPYSQAILTIAKTDSLVRRLDITEASGQVRSVVLKGLRVNGAIPDKEFKISVPAGVHVVNQ
ncbi:MAG TPA: outer membrane lipoprotein chaperone LolA [Gemmatimonadales bacterium]|nr:outer membrane lipoprotein chaperone LolA [Gemmatimonadales bacterium]